MGMPPDYDINVLDAELEQVEEYVQPEGEICPACQNKWCHEIADENGIDIECETYYDGCHCCVLCHGFPRCEHGLWATDKCTMCGDK